MKKYLILIHGVLVEQVGQLFVVRSSSVKEIDNIVSYLEKEGFLIID